jgi:hypothetical protein
MPIFVRRILGGLVTAVALTFLYFISWTVSYVFAMGTDSSFYFEYLRMFWTLDAGEKPFLIGLGSLVIFLALSIMALRRVLQFVRKG